MENTNTQKTCPEPYETPDMSIIRLHRHDVITTSVPGLPNVPEDTSPTDPGFWGDNDAEPDMG